MGLGSPPGHLCLEKGRELGHLGLEAYCKTYWMRLDPNVLEALLVHLGLGRLLGPLSQDKALGTSLAYDRPIQKHLNPKKVLAGRSPKVKRLEYSGLGGSHGSWLWSCTFYMII